jgi:GNAT superfamily N-acetyltransferase
MDIKHIQDKQQKTEIAAAILEALPDWFGIPESTLSYIKESADMPFLAAFDGGKPVGFIVIKENNPYTAEIYVMGILTAYHRLGIGRALVQEALEWAKERSFELLEVKTLDESHPDIYYARTRQFYRAMGFLPLECVPEIWGKENPCLILVRKVSK